MARNDRKIVIIGGGIAGLCAAVYAQKCGYQAEVLEMHDMAGGLAMSWRRGAYTFETCLHWFFGSDPKAAMYAQWSEVFDVGRLKFVDLPEFARLETDDGETLTIPTDPDRLEKELLERAPQDAKQIRGFASAIRRLRAFKMPDPSKSWVGNAPTLLRDVPCLPQLRSLTRVTSREYGQRFTDPLLRTFFVGGDLAGISAIAILASIAWMDTGDAKYVVGGAQAIIRLIEEKFVSLGGRVRFGAKVERILVENGAAAGVQLAGGETIKADWIISAADGHATIYELLGGRYVDAAIEKAYKTLELFPSYIQVSLGVARDLRNQPAFVTRLLKTPLQVDPETALKQVSFRIFHFDPTFAPAGKTAVTCLLPTRNFDYWARLRQNDAEKYREEKHRVAELVIDLLGQKLPGIRQTIEVVDVATPASIFRYTGNWKGSMEGWLLTPQTGFKSLSKTLPGLHNFLMVGQWVTPGGGLPSGIFSARPALKTICRQDRIPFTPR
ncbi:MAG: NAD(P)/FAD-dependent oxidoreductase [Terracidiphilus sp.]|jgi:phytoene dehydrogenase-like protein